MILFTEVKRTEPQLLIEMNNHYSKPKGFVGRNICYRVTYDGQHYGHIVGGSATKYLPNRDIYLGINSLAYLNEICNNIFYHVEPINGKYPLRNFTTKVIQKFEKIIFIDWYKKYNTYLIALESLVELPRTGECYRRAGWENIGETKGYTCKRESGISTDSWSGKRVWNTQDLRPKYVFIKRIAYDALEDAANL